MKSKKQIACISNDLLRAPIEEAWPIEDFRFFIGVVATVNPLCVILKPKVNLLRQLNEEALTVRKSKVLSRDEKINEIHGLNKKKNAIYFSTHTFTKKEFVKLIGCEYRISNAQLLKIANRVQTRTKVIDLYDTHEEGSSAHVIFPNVVFDINNDILTVELNKELMPHFVDLAQSFSYIDPEILQHISNIKVSMTYVLLKSYLWYCSRFKRSVNISIDDFKQTLGIKDSYPTNRNINQKVFQPSFNGINSNDHLDINVQYNLIRKNKRFDRIEFKVEPRINNLDTYKQLMNAETSTDMLLLIGVTKSVAQEYGGIFEAQIVFDIVYASMVSIENGKLIENHAGYVIDRLDRLNANGSIDIVDDNGVSIEEAWNKLELFLSRHENILNELIPTIKDNLIYWTDNIGFIENFKEIISEMDSYQGIQNRAVLMTYINDVSKNFSFYKSIAECSSPTTDEWKQHILSEIEKVNQRISTSTTENKESYEIRKDALKRRLVSLL